MVAVQKNKQTTTKNKNKKQNKKQKQKNKTKTKQTNKQTKKRVCRYQKLKGIMHLVYVFVESLSSRVSNLLNMSNQFSILSPMNLFNFQ